MDKYVAPNFNRREAVSSFGEVDAGYIDNAARALKKAGDVVIVEAQHRPLRDHYVKQIMAQLLALCPHILVNRCRKDRDWMVAAINQAFVKNKVSGEKRRAGRLNEVWILELSSSEDLGILKLAQTLVSQFEEAGVCVLVSCSSSLTSLPEFSRWSNRVEIPVWQFEVPGASEITAFLEQEAQNGAINQARKLVDQLRFPGEEYEWESAAALEESNGKVPKEFTQGHSSADDSINDNLVIPIKAQPEAVSVENALSKKEEDQDLKKSLKPSVANTKIGIEEFDWGSMRLATFGFIILIAAMSSVFFLSKNNISTIEYQEHIETSATKFLSDFLFLNENDGVTPISINETVGRTTLIDGREGLVISKGDKAVKFETEALLPAEPVSGSTEVSRFETSELMLGSDYEQRVPMAPTVAVAATRNSVGYFVQYAAFGNRNSALWYKINQGREFEDALIATKPSGLWVVVSGPYPSKELAKGSLQERKADIYVISGSELIFN